MGRHHRHQVSVVNANVLRCLSDLGVICFLCHYTSLVIRHIFHRVVEPLLHLQSPPVWQLQLYIVFQNNPNELVERRPLAQALRT